MLPVYCELISGWRSCGFGRGLSGHDSLPLGPDWPSGILVGFSIDEIMFESEVIGDVDMTDGFSSARLLIAAITLVYTTAR